MNLAAKVLLFASMKSTTKWVALIIVSLLQAFVCGCATKIEMEQSDAHKSVSTKSKDSNMVIIKTSKGNIEVELYADKAPVTVKNFLSYVESNHYEGTIFHRVIPNFMIQGGGFDINFRQKATAAPIVNEAANGLKNTRGTLAMARTMEVNSATAQFFINTVDNDFLDHKTKTPQGFGYCVFGKVVKGMDVVDKIAAIKTGNRGPHQNVPLENIIIVSINAAK